MNIRDLKTPERIYVFNPNPLIKALHAGSMMILKRVNWLKNSLAGAQLTNPETIAEAQALLNLEQELWERANWQPEELPVTSENGVPE